jgi:hypothetical protein
MIEDKKIGMKWAESEEEAWAIDTIKASKEQIKQYYRMIDLTQNTIKYLETKVKKPKKDKKEKAS